jgi:phosphate transport system substrate-binding protein
MRLRHSVISAFAAFGMVFASSSTAHAADLTGSGSSFAFKYITACKATSGHTVTYSSTGSGTGRNNFNDGVTDFGASDSASALSKATGKYVYIPVVGGPISLPYNVPEIQSTPLKLDATTLAKILRGSITKWNDGAIAALNTGLPLPNKPIIVVYRSASSGTTENMTDYLNKVVPKEWPKAKNGTFASATPSLPRGAKGAANSQVLVSTVKATKYSIGYADLSDAVASKLPFAQLKNENGEFLLPSTDGASKFLGDFSASDPLTGVAVDFTKKIAGAYNMSLFTYVIAPKAGGVKAGTNVSAVKDVVNHLLSGCTAGTALGYSQISGNLLTAAKGLVTQIG